MKKILVILAFGLFVFGNQSCRKPPLPVIDTMDTTGNGGGGVVISPYVGEWSYTKIDLKNGTLKFMGQNAGTFTGYGKDIVGSVTITQNPNKYSTELEFTAVVSTQFGDQETPVDKQISSGTWTESNGQITLTDNSGKDISIISSTSSKIVFTGTFSDAIVTQFGSIDATSDVEFTIEK